VARALSTTAHALCFSMSRRRGSSERHQGGERGSARESPEPDPVLAKTSGSAGGGAIFPRRAASSPTSTAAARGVLAWRPAMPAREPRDAGGRDGAFPAAPWARGLRSPPVSVDVGPDAGDTHSRTAIAVLPFGNLSAAAQAGFAAGLHDELLTLCSPRWRRSG
jgi:hypothetical protein